MKTKTKKIEVFVADDGAEFLAAADCEKHEKTLNRHKNFSIFSVTHNPDLTEGRGYYGLLYILVESIPRDYSQPAAINQALAHTFLTLGSPVGGGVQGGYGDAWHFREVQPDTINISELHTRTTSVGDYSYPCKIVVISTNPEPFIGITPIHPKDLYKG